LSELVDLDLIDVNLSGPIVRVRGKGRKERLVPFNRTAADAIRAMLVDRPALPAPAAARGPRDRQARAREALFLNLRGRRLTTRSVDRIVRRYVQERRSRKASHRTRCGIPSRRIYCRPAPTCAPSRNYSATRG
jgi:integrase/recombinase XerC